MHEGFKANQNESEFIQAQTPEATANKEWRATELVLSRLAHPRIKQQLVDIMYQHNIDEHERFRDEEWIPCTIEGMEKDFTEGKRTGVVIANDSLDTFLSSRQVVTRDQVEAEIDSRIEKAALETVISYTNDGPNMLAMPLKWNAPGTTARPTTEQLSMIEAHEKGHSIRTYDHLTEKWQDAFDISNMEITAEDIEHLRTFGSISATDERDVRTQVDDCLRHYLFSADEIAERMSQLKNYYGFAHDEVFTKEHLEYARSHYVQDLGIDNHMTLFFKAITPKTEDRFLEIINTSGI
jgi:hypothetical protein